MIKLKISLYSLVILSTLTVSCDKNETVVENNQSVSDLILLLTQINDITHLTEEAFESFDSRLRTSSVSENECKTIVHDPTNKQLVIDFSNNSCLSTDGVSRKGKIIIDYTGSIRSEGAVTNISLDNYYSGSVQYFGKLKITTQGDSKFNLVVENLRYAIDKTDSVSCTGTFTKALTNTNVLDNSSDDLFELSGNFTGKDKLLQTFKGLVSNPLLLSNNCFENGYFFPTKGIVEINTINFTSRTIDFGQGSCDKSIVLSTINGSETVRY